jgi:hypothetical protein
MSTEQAILMLVTIFIVMLLLYLATRLITATQDLDVNYFFRLLMVSVVAVVVVPILGTIGNAIGVPEISPVIAFIALLYVVKYLIVNEVGGVDEWQESIWITFFTLLFLYLLSAALDYMADIRLTLL